jgi:hypothetical protein
MNTPRVKSSRAPEVCPEASVQRIPESMVPLEGAASVGIFKIK